jgi:hypothetical protein
MWVVFFILQVRRPRFQGQGTARCVESVLKGDGWDKRVQLTRVKDHFICEFLFEDGQAD